MHTIERPSGCTNYYDYINNTGATLIQNWFVLKVTGAGVGFPVLGNIPDNNGIVNLASGKIESQEGSVWQIAHDQLAAEVVAQIVDTPIYMAPGAGNFHITPVLGDYEVGFLTHAQGAETWIRAQFTPPRLLPVEEIPT